MPVFPLPRHRDGRKANISDGFHSRADFKAGRAPREHRGADLLYWCSPAVTPNHPYTNKNGRYEIPSDYDVPVLAPQTGVVVASAQLATGWWVALGLSKGLGFAVHHLKAALVTTGAVVGEGTTLGFVGGSPRAGDYGLFHAHVDYATGCGFAPTRLRALGRLDGRFVDPEPYLRTCRHVDLSETGFGASPT
jgi:murein DD-endopeptidase MepM/ murein hydrolase activator NlpD